MKIEEQPKFPTWIWIIPFCIVAVGILFGFGFDIQTAKHNLVRMGFSEGYETDNLGNLIWATERSKGKKYCFVDHTRSRSQGPRRYCITREEQSERKRK